MRRLLAASRPARSSSHTKLRELQDAKASPARPSPNLNGTNPPAPSQI